MKKQIITIIFGILLLVNISALYGGESFILDIEEDYEYYSIVGNISEVVLDIQQNGTVLTITPDKYSVDDTYELIFFNREREIIYVSSGGGGGGRTRYEVEKIVEKEIVDRNITEYVDKIVKTPGEIIKEYVGENNLWQTIAIIILVSIIIVILAWNFISKRYKSEEYVYTNEEGEEHTYTNEKEVKEKK